MGITTHFSNIIRNIFISGTDRISLQERESDLHFFSRKKKIVVLYLLILSNVTGIPPLTTRESKWRGFKSDSCAIPLSCVEVLLHLGLQTFRQVKISRKRIEKGTREFNNILAVWE